VLTQLRQNAAAIHDIEALQAFEASPDPTLGDRPMMMVRDAAKSVVHLAAKDYRRNIGEAAYALETGVA
jgi:hypothetical protein